VYPFIVDCDDMVVHSVSDHVLCPAMCRTVRESATCGPMSPFIVDCNMVVNSVSDHVLCPAMCRTVCESAPYVFHAPFGDCDLRGCQQSV
jgi:hypothetical protein